MFCPNCNSDNVKVESVQENCSDILADAKAINEAKAAEREAAYIEDAAKV
jgi:hypothetical protein